MAARSFVASSASSTRTVRRVSRCDAPRHANAWRSEQEATTRTTFWRGIYESNEALRAESATCQTAVGPWAAMDKAPAADQLARGFNAAHQLRDPARSDEENRDCTQVA